MAHCFQRLAAAAFAASSSSKSFAFACSHCCGCCGAATLLLPVDPSPASSRQAGQPCCGRRHGHPCGCKCPHHETERGAAAKVLSRTGSEGVRGGFREQSWKGCLRPSLTGNRCKPNFRGSGVYVPRSVDWHRASRCIISLIQRNTDGNQVAPLTREHPRRRYTPVDYPWTGPKSNMDRKAYGVTKRDGDR